MGWVSALRPGNFNPGKEIRYPFYMRLSEPQGRPGQVRQTLSTPGFDSRTIQPVMSLYTDNAIPAHKEGKIVKEFKIYLCNTYIS